MKTLGTTRKHPLALTGLVLGCLGTLFFATGCMLGAESEVKAETEIEGVLEGDVTSETNTTGSLGKSAAEVEGAVVTLHEVSLDGAPGRAVAEARTAADGSFKLRTDLTGPRVLIVKIVREGREWKAVVEEKLEAGKAKAVGAVNLETTVDAEVWLELKKTPEGRAALAAEIRAAVEAYKDTADLKAFRGSDTARARLIVNLVHAVQASANARGNGVADLKARVEAAIRADSVAAARDTARDSGDTAARPVRPRPRPVLTPCEQAAVVLAGMATTDSGYAEMRARFAAHCLERGDTVPPAPQACAALSARLEWMDSTSPAYEVLRARVAAFCDGTPPPPLTRCERAAVRLAAMNPERPAHAVLKARYEAFCTDEDEANDGGVEVEATATLDVPKSRP